MKSGQANAHPVNEHAFLVLDGLRGVAAISVLIYHYVGFLSHYAQRGLTNAFLAVDFFFALSGFIIAYAYEQRLLSGQTPAQFMLRRLIRLYPLFALGLSISIVRLAANSLSAPASFFTQFPVAYVFGLFFLPTPGALAPTSETLLLSPHSVFPLNGPAWTLSLEIGINLVYALLIRYLTTPRLALLAFLGGVGFTIALFSLNDIEMGWDWSTYAGGWARVTWSFFVGVLLYRLFASRKEVRLPAWVGLALAAGLMADFVCFGRNRSFTYISCIALLPLVVWIGAKTDIWQPARRVYAWLGKTSYALYIIHLPLMPLFVHVAMKLHVDPYTHIAPMVAVSAVLAILITWGIDVVYDTPVRGYLTRKLTARKNR